MKKNSAAIKLAIIFAYSLSYGCSLEQPKKEDSSAGKAPTQSDLTLTWDGSNDGSIVAFKVYLAGEENEAGSLIETIDATTLQFNTDEPMGILHTSMNKTLGEYVGRKSCFAISAVDQDGEESERSTPVCVTL